MSDIYTISDKHTNKIAIYLIKEQYSDHNHILKETKGTKETSDPKPPVPLIINNDAVFYYSESKQSQPLWVKNFFGSSLSEIENLLYNKTTKGVLLISANVNSDKRRTFAIPFGYGWTLLNPGVWEERFGLKVALNILDDENVRRIDKKNISSVSKDISEQLSLTSEIADFGIDIEQDLICSITGKTKEMYQQFGKTVTGKDAIYISTKVDILNVTKILKMCYERYISKDYTEKFGWIDHIMDIRDTKVKKKLNDILIKKIKDEDFNKIWMAVPGLVDWHDVRGFVYDKKSSEEPEDDIYLKGFLNSLKENNDNNELEIKIETLKERYVYCISESNGGMPMHKWRAYNCLHCEIKIKNTLYLLNNGRWYEIEKEFASNINEDYKEMYNKPQTLELPKYDHKNEAEYNKIVAEDNQKFYCMDRENIIYGGGYSKIEFCDLYTKDKQIIHVKRYGGSGVLSHLFAQGVVSGELFMAEKEFRKKVNEKLPDSHKINDYADKPKDNDYQVIFAIISASKKDLEIPFFSKVTLRNAKRRLETYGYKVALLKINTEEL